MNDRLPFDNESFYRARVVARVLPILLPFFEDEAPVDIRRSVLTAPDVFWRQVYAKAGLSPDRIPSTKTKSALIAHLEEAAVREATAEEDAAASMLAALETLVAPFEGETDVSDSIRAARDAITKAKGGVA